MISQRPSNSLIGVTHSDAQAWLQCDWDVLNVWPQATGYSYILAFEGWPHWNGPNVALLWEVFGPDCPGPTDNNLLREWTQSPDAVRHAQHVFLLPDVLDCQPLLIYRPIGAPDQELVETAVKRARTVYEAERRRELERDQAPFDWEGE